MMDLIETSPRLRGRGVVPRLTLCTPCRLRPLAAMEMWNPLDWRMEGHGAAANPAHVPALSRLDLKEVDLARGATDLTFITITGMTDMVRYVYPLLIRVRHATSVITRRLTMGPLIRTFARAVSTAAPVGPTMPSAPGAVSMLVVRVRIPAMNPLTR